MLVIEKTPIFCSILWTSFTLGVLVFFCTVCFNVHTTVAADNQNITLECKDLQPGQYWCDDPEVDDDTQQAAGCREDYRYVKVPCHPVQGITCSGQTWKDEDDPAFHKEVPCKWTNGKSFEVALLLSIFLGWLGIDRFYLGYPAIGLVKLCTLGFMFLGQLIDILLIALQVVGPSDGSDYVIDYYGAGLTAITRDNDTFIKPHYS